MSKLRILFMGTPDFALESCRAIYENHILLGVVTQPDRPKGRGGKTQPPPVKEYATKLGLPCWQPTILKDGSFQGVLDETKPDMIVVAAYGRILPEYILNYPRYGCINVHGSLLPKYRGAAPIQRAVINGDSETGVTIMRMAKGMDTGDMILKRSTPILPSDTSGTVFDRLAVLGAEALLEAIDRIADGTAEYVVQNEEEATHAPMIDKAEGALDFSWPAQTLRNRVMGMNPSPGAFIELANYRLKLFDAYLDDQTSSAPGTVTAIKKNGISIACGDGFSVRFESVQKQGKNRIDAYSYACGAKLSVGDLLK
ncbi:MAG: methionyl-tRNA formyltransferase [Clostridia bacterium]|nr:methionyl-tRNA formyltransferase [Clostridia bacterium]